MKKKICCFCEQWESGGIESFLAHVLARLDPAHFAIDIVAARLGESVFTEGLARHGVGFYELSGTPRRVLENGRQFQKLLEARLYDVVHLHLYQGLSLRYAWLAKRAGVPVRIAHSHNTALRKSPLRGLKLLLHYGAREVFTGSATTLWACSSAAAGFLFPGNALRRRGCRFIPNGIDTGRFRFNQTVRDEVRRELGLEGAFVIGHVGRLCLQKNQGFLLEAMRSVLSREPEAVLLLIGEGEEQEALARSAARLGLQDRVRFCGVSEHIEGLFWAMDVFAFPSLFEGLGIAAVEAQAAGLRVVASENVPQEANAAGRLQTVPLAWGAQAWAEALSEAPRSTAGRASGAAQVREAGFDIEDVGKGIARFYQET